MEPEVPRKILFIKNNSFFNKNDFDYRICCVCAKELPMEINLVPPNSDTHYYSSGEDNPHKVNLTSAFLEACPVFCHPVAAVLSVSRSVAGRRSALISHSRRTGQTLVPYLRAIRQMLRLVLQTSLLALKTDIPQEVSSPEFCMYSSFTS
jgi:hypothetical protein